MTKMAAMPIYGKKTLKSTSLEPEVGWPWDLVCSIRDVGPTKFVQIMILGWPWLFNVQVKFCFLMHLNNIFWKSCFFETVEALVIILTWYV